MKTKPLAGRIFGRLIALKIHHTVAGRGSYWTCRCKCGASRVVRRDALISGATRSCGCLHRETARRQGQRSKIHGMSKTPLYRVWNAMLHRCNDPKNWAYKYYGGRGIKVCRRWLKFANFYADMGDCPAGLTLDRKNNNGDYRKGNCRWASREEQASNNRRARLLTLDGRTQTLSRWAREKKMLVGSLWHRINHLGWSVERALQTP
jgi:hypothetical protein